LSAEMSTRTVCAAAVAATARSAEKEIKQRTSSDRIHASAKVLTTKIQPAQTDFRRITLRPI